MLNMKLYLIQRTLESVDSKYVKHPGATDATYEYEVKAGGEAKEGEAEGGEADEDKKKVIRPPYVDFEWKDIKFQGVMEKVSVTYLMFKADGTPLRAQVDVTLKERNTTLVKAANLSANLIADGEVVDVSKTYVYTGEHEDETTVARAVGKSTKHVLKGKHTYVCSSPKALKALHEALWEQPDEKWKDYDKKVWGAPWEPEDPVSYAMDIPEAVPDEREPMEYWGDFVLDANTGTPDPPDPYTPADPVEYVYEGADAATKDYDFTDPVVLEGVDYDPDFSGYLGTEAIAADTGTAAAADAYEAEKKEYGEYDRIAANTGESEKFDGTEVLAAIQEQPQMRMPMRRKTKKLVNTAESTLRPAKAKVRRYEALAANTGRVPRPMSSALEAAEEAEVAKLDSVSDDRESGEYYGDDKIEAQTGERKNTADS